FGRGRTAGARRTAGGHRRSAFRGGETRATRESQPGSCESQRVSESLRRRSAYRRGAAGAGARRARGRPRGALQRLPRLFDTRIVAVAIPKRAETRKSLADSPLLPEFRRRG